ncbi:MAG: hypothetical protein CR982_05625 [Candidatus Cloacimonadota bacterium]|nr:MAG: hypothetical protein CR982_05625 [Candidatus Cloacimonadota bacterium]PIE81398.1 MAG: hypothetical protein CSA15_00745 [Candidatus Delongbacteria bacterium]
MKDLFAFRYLFKGGGFLLKNKTLFKYIFLQIITGVILFSLFFVLATTHGGGIYDKYFIYLKNDPSIWYNILYYLVMPFFFLILFGLGTYLTFLVTQLVVSPINTLLAQKTAKLYRGFDIEDSGSFFKGLLKDIRYEIVKFIIFSLVYILLFSLIIIPVIGGVLFIVLSTIFTIFSLSFEFIEISMDREKTSVRHRISLLLKRPFMTFSYGGGIFILFALPIIGIIFYPIAVIGATLLYEDRISSENINKNSRKEIS